MASFFDDIKKKYDPVEAQDLSNKLHKYPDDLWNLISEWYYHQSLEVYLDSLDASELDAHEAVQLKKKYQQDDIERALLKASKFHGERADELYSEIDKNYPEVGENLFDSILGTPIADKFEKWMHSDRVYNLGGDPLQRYLA